MTNTDDRADEARTPEARPILSAVEEDREASARRASMGKMGPSFLPTVERRVVDERSVDCPVTAEFQRRLVAARLEVLAAQIGQMTAAEVARLEKVLTR